MTTKSYCSQCLLDTNQLHKKSHIIPRFMFREILGKERPEIVFADHKHFNQIGSVHDAPYDEQLFCFQCENKSQSSIESQASQILFHQQFSPEKISRINGNGINQHVFFEADVDIFKKFLILILWRAHLSNHKFFHDINLGPYCEKFRKIINNEAELNTSNCQFYIFNFKNVLKKELQHFCTPFYHLRIEDRNCYSLFIDGVGYLYQFGKPIRNILDKSIEAPEGLRINLPFKRNSNLLLNKMFQIKGVKLIKEIT